MARLISAYAKAFGQLSDRKTRSVVWTAVGWSVAIFIGLYASLKVILSVTTFIAIGWLETLFDFVVQFGVLLLTWFLFPAVVTAVGALMLEKVVVAVEQRHYPKLLPTPGMTFKDSLGPTLKFLGTTVGLNLLTLPLLLIPPLFPFVYYGLNGYLLSREYFELVALRRLRVQDAQALRLRWRTPLLIAGVGFAFMLTVPFLNLIAPIIATAATVHLFEAWRRHDHLGDTLAPRPGTTLNTGSNTNPNTNPTVTDT